MARVSELLAATLALLLGAGASSAQSLAVEHTPITCVVAGRHPYLDACFTAAAPIARARIAFRAAATPDWYWVDMAPQGECFAALLPKPKKSIVAIEYYVEGIDRASAEGRTPQYAPRVAAAGDCDEQPAAGLLGSVAIRLSAPPGAPPIPAGFSSTGIVAAGGAAGTAGISSQTIGLAVGGAALAVGGLALAAGGGGSADEADEAPEPATCSADQIQMTRVVFDPPSFECPRGGTPVSFTVNLLADVTNRSAVEVTIQGASPEIPVVATAPNSQGSGLTPTFSGRTLAAGTSATIQVTLSGNCTNSNTDSDFRAGFMEFGGSLTLRTSCGSVSAAVQGRFRIDFP